MNKNKLAIKIIIGILVCLFLVGLCVFAWQLLKNGANNIEDFNNNFDYTLIDKYKKIDSYYKEKPVITIVYSSTSKNMKKHSKNIASVLKQTVRADRILFALPLDEEVKNTFRDLPKWMYKMGIPLPVIKCKSDSHRDNAILTHVNLFKMGKHIGIVLYDNVNYEPGYIEKLLKNYEAHDDGVNLIDKNKSMLFRPENFVASDLVQNIVLSKLSPIKYKA